jgi:hypothetical protein
LVLSKKSETSRRVSRHAKKMYIFYEKTQSGTLHSPVSTKQKLQ